MKPVKQHYFLAATKVVFETPEGEPAMSEHNCTLRWPTKDLNAKAIGQIQQLAQLLLRKNVVNDPAYKVRDVFVLGISYLGFMSEEQFLPTTEQPEEQAAPQPTPGNHALLNPAVGLSASPFDLEQGEQRNVSSTGSGGV